MLLELHVRDFAIIQAARLSLGPGLTVLTGETGAGKSILVDAVALLLGARGDPGAVRAGADRAVIQGVFAEPSSRVSALLAEMGAPAEPGEPLIVDREVHAAGRSVARISGHTVTARDLARLAALLVDLHGQSDTASLRRESDQLELVDRYAGLESERAAFADLADRLRAIEEESLSLQTDDAARARRSDMLAFQIAEIREAGLTQPEEADLAQERLRLANAEKLAQLAAAAASELAGTADEQAAVDHLDRASSALTDLAAIDTELGALRDVLLEAAESARDVARQVAAYRDGLEFQPGRLDEVEERSAVFADLKRKYGGTVEAVLAWAERAAAELDGMANASDRLAKLDSERAATRQAMAPLADRISASRAEAGGRLAVAVAAEAEALELAATKLAVVVEQTEDPAGLVIENRTLAFDRRGIDRVRFDVTTNPGEPLRPLAKIASGGEAARIMLAIKGVLGRADETPTLIFDEVDAGIGGRVGAAVGRKLWQLARSHQVLCVTHLPQVAAYADLHVHVRKGEDSGRTVTTLDALDTEGRAAELTQMLGTVSDAGRTSAVELLVAAEEWKRRTAPRDP